MDLKQNNLTKKAMKVSSGALAALSVFSNSAFALSPNDILKKAKTMVVPAVVTTATAAAAVSVLGLTGVLIWKIPSLMSEKTEVVVSDELIGGIANKIDLATKEKMLTSFDEVRECLGLKKDEKGIFSKLKEDLDTNINKDEYREKFEDNCGCFFSSVRLLLGEKLFPGKNKTGKNKNGKLSESEKSFLNDVVGKIKAAVLAKSKNKNDVDGAASDLTKPSGDQNSDQQSGQSSNQQLEQKSAQLSAPAEVEVAEVPAANSTQENTADNKETSTDENKSENVEEANKKTAEENSASVENKGEEVKEEVKEDAVDKEETAGVTSTETPVVEKKPAYVENKGEEVKKEVKKDVDVKKEIETTPVETPVKGKPASVEREVEEVVSDEDLSNLKKKIDEYKANFINGSEMDFTKDAVLNSITGEKGLLGLRFKTDGYIGELLEVIKKNNGEKTVIFSKIKSCRKEGANRSTYIDLRLTCLKDEFLNIYGNYIENKYNRGQDCKGLNDSIVKDICLVAESIYEFLNVYCEKVNRKTGNIEVK